MNVANRRDEVPFSYWPYNRLNVPHLTLRALVFFAIALGLIGLGGWLYLRQVSEVAAYAHEIRVLERQKEQLRREITALRAEVALSGALARVREEGRKLGYALPEATDGARSARIEVQGVAGASLSPTTVQADEAPPTSATGVLPTLLAQLRAWIASPTEQDAGR